MKKLTLGIVVIGLLVALVLTQDSTVTSKDELSCSSFNYIQYAVKGIAESKGMEYGNAYLSGWLSHADCKNITEGMNLKIIKVKNFDKNYAGYTKGLLVKMPIGTTTWIAR